MRSLPLVLALAVLAGSAGAVDGAALVEAARADCARIEGGVLTVGEGAVRSIDVTGDGQPETFVDQRHFTCSTSASMWCGTGGCGLQVVVDGTAHEVLARAWTVVAWDDLQVLLLRRHPSACGMAPGLPPCVEALVWDEGGWRTVAR